MTTRAQLLALVLLSMLLLVAALTGIYLWSAASHRDQLAEQRNLFLLQSLRGATENYLAMGSNLDQMSALQSLIERERASFPEVLAIDVYSASGQVLYSTDAGSRGAKVPEDWVLKLERAGHWETQDPAQDQMGMRFENDLGRAAGGVVLTLAPADRPWTLAQWRQAVVEGLRLLALALACCLLAVLGAWWGQDRLLAVYRRITLRFQQPEDGEPKPSDPAAGELEQLARQTTRNLSLELAQARLAMQRLQELDRAD